eukprot:s28_g21.t1
MARRGNLESWEYCDKILAEAWQDEKPRLVTADVLLGIFEDGAETEAAVPLDEVFASPRPSGLGRQADRLLGGGLWPGEVAEIYGAPGAGKTQLGLCLAMHAASGGIAVHYLTNKDPPAILARRLQTLALAREEVTVTAEILLDKIRISDMADFTAFARLMTHALARPESMPGLIVLDGLSVLLSPFTSATSWSHRWRLTWSWRMLRQLAMVGCCVVLLSHTAGSMGTSQLALGQQWSHAASVRLELSRPLAGNVLCLCLRKSCRQQLCQSTDGDEVDNALSADLIIDEAGIHVSSSMANPRP